VDDRVFDAVQIWQPRFPIIRVADHGDALVGFEFAEFKRAGPNRVLPHLSRRDMAGIDWRKPAGKKHRKCRLRPLQMKGHLVIAVGGDLFKVLVAGPARVYAKLLARLFDQ